MKFHKKSFFFVWLALITVSLANPLQWMTGSYLGGDASQQIYESWQTTADGAIGTSIWMENGELTLQETAFLRSLGKDRYSLDLWIKSSENVQHIAMTGQLDSKKQRLDLKVAPDQHPESLSYQKDAKGHLRVTLAKKSLIQFDLVPVADVARWAASELAGSYSAFTFFPEKTFEDQIELSYSSGLEGTLEVPGKFKVPLDGIEVSGFKLLGPNLRFEGLIPEGKIPYKVRYRLQFLPSLAQAHGTLEDEAGKVLASVVLVRRQADKKSNLRIH